MTSRWHIGANKLRGQLSAYAKRFDLLEVRMGVPVAAFRADRSQRLPSEEPSPSLGKLRRWRRLVPPHFHFAVVAGPHLVRVRPSEEGDRELELARMAIDALQARCFVFRTPPEVTPTALWRDRIAKIISCVPHDVTHFVWEPSGVWENADAAAQARSWGAVLAVDPLRDPVPPGMVAYLRLRALGEIQSFGLGALERAVRAVGSRPREVFAILESDSAVAESKLLRRLLQSFSGELSGTAGRPARPRRNIVVGDDEQE